MYSKKAILTLGLLAMILIISEVSAKDLTETSSNTQKEVVEQTNEVNDAKYGSYNGGYPGRGGNYGPGYPGNGRGNGGYPGRRGGYCRYGCCGGGYRSCRRCCSYAGEAVAMQTMDKTHN